MIETEVLVLCEIRFQELYQGIVEVVLVARFLRIPGGCEVDGVLDLFGQVEVFSSQQRKERVEQVQAGYAVPLVGLHWVRCSSWKCPA